MTPKQHARVTNPHRAAAGMGFTVALLIILGAFLFKALQSGPTREMAPQVVQVMQEALPADFARLEFTQRAYNDALAPTLVYEGKTATILATHKPQVTDGALGPVVVLQGLARTPNGRYFDFTYKSALARPSKSWPYFDEVCTAQRDCRYFSSYGAISEQRAKAWVFDSDEFTAASYQAIFKETPPIKRLPA